MNITIISCGEVGYSYAKVIANIKYILQICAQRPSEKVLKLVSEKNNFITYTARRLVKQF